MIIIVKILIHINIISTNARPKDWKLKKIKLQQKFKNNCMLKMVTAFFLNSLESDCNIMYKDIPINMYRVVHTGPNK